jgi:hypothetical protein
MKDFMEIMSFCSFDVRTMNEIVNEILEEAGLDGMEKIPAEPAGEERR